MILGCGTISKICFEIDEDLLDDLKSRALENESDCRDLIVECIRNGLGSDDMAMVCLNDNVMEKVNIMAKLTKRTPEEVVNETLNDQLRDVENIPTEFDGDKIWSMLEHDKPEGDDILDNLARFGEENWD